MSAPKTDAVDGAASGDSCGGVSSGIASALADGSLDLGGDVSEMSYECNEVIEDDSQYDKTVENAPKPGEKKSTKNTLINKAEDAKNEPVIIEEPPVETDETYPDMAIRLLQEHPYKSGGAGAVLLIIIICCIRKCKRKIVKKV